MATILPGTDFVMFAPSMGSDGLVATSLARVVEQTRAAFEKDHPTVIVVKEQSDWLAYSSLTRRESLDRKRPAHRGQDRVRRSGSTYPVG